MRDVIQQGRFIGYVHVRVGDELVALPVQALPLTSDGMKAPGGFFVEARGGLGILVDSEATEADTKAQIDAAIADAVAHLSRRVLN